MRLNGGVIIIGSLLWQHDLCPEKFDNVRRSWRNAALILDEKILVKLPIRYGRYSKGSIYTMVFSTRCEKTQRLGTGAALYGKYLRTRRNIREEYIVSEQIPASTA